MRRLKQLEDENFKLEQIVADLSLDKETLQDAIPKTSRAVRKRKLVDEMRGARNICHPPPACRRCLASG